MTNEQLAKLYSLITGESERVFAQRFTDAQAAVIAANIDEELSSNDIFGAADLAADASALDVDAVFSGAAGTAKLVAWAVADALAAIAADTAGLAALVDWAVADELAAIVADADGLAKLVAYAATNFSPLMSVTAFGDAAKAYIAANIVALAAVTEIHAALETAGWTHA